MELLNLQSNANIHKKSSETKLQVFYSYLPKEDFLYSSLLDDGNVCVCVCEGFYFLQILIRWTADHDRQMDT